MIKHAISDLRRYLKPLDPRTPEELRDRISQYIRMIERRSPRLVDQWRKESGGYWVMLNKTFLVELHKKTRGFTKLDKVINRAYQEDVVTRAKEEIAGEAEQQAINEETYVAITMRFLDEELNEVFDEAIKAKEIDGENRGIKHLRNSLDKFFAENSRYTDDW